MNAMTTAQSTAVAVAGDRNAFEQYSDAVSRNRIVGDLLKFSKGEYLAGQDGDEIEEGTELVANLDELMVGWLKWDDDKPTDMKMGKVVEGYTPVPRKDLGDTDDREWDTDDRGQPRDPWQLTNYLIMKEPGGDKLYTFTTSSKGGMSAVGKLCGLYGKRLRTNPGEFPIVALNVDSYRHSNKSYGKIFVPDFKVVGWTEKSEFAEALAAADAAASGRDDSGQEDDPEDTVLPPPKPAKGKAAAADATKF